MKQTLTVAVLSVLAALAAGCGTRLPPDDELIEHFNTHRDDLNQLVRLLEADSQLEHLSGDRILPADSISSERTGEYLALMRKAGIQTVGRNKDDRLTFTVFEESPKFSPVVDHSFKGYTFTTNSLPTVENTEIHKAREGRWYRRIERHWYLYYLHIT